MRSHKTRRFLASASVCVAVLTLLVGCGAAAPDRSRPEKEPARQVPTTDTDTDRAVTSRAEALLVQTCIQRKGHRYWVAAPLDEEETHSDGSRIKQKDASLTRRLRHAAARGGVRGYSGLVPIGR